jgi:hypothetical protein
MQSSSFKASGGRDFILFISKNHTKFKLSHVHCNINIMLYFHIMQTLLLVMEIGTTTIVAKFIFRHGKPIHESQEQY